MLLGSLKHRSELSPGNPTRTRILLTSATALSVAPISLYAPASISITSPRRISGNSYGVRLHPLQYPSRLPVGIHLRPKYGFQPSELRINSLLADRHTRHIADYGVGTMGKFVKIPPMVLHTATIGSKECPA